VEEIVNAVTLKEEVSWNILETAGKPAWPEAS
jgi:hypothetical protein